MELIAIGEEIYDNQAFIENPRCQEGIHIVIEYYKKIGFYPPWIGYYVRLNDQLVGSAGFKGPPINGQIEIAYGVFEDYRCRGIGTSICKQLVTLSLGTDPGLRITARTLPAESYSTRILRKNNFILIGMVEDPEDGPVWEWLFKGVELTPLD
jgi:ribosomal-protein-alanine N-acetyltransferase